MIDLGSFTADRIYLDANVFIYAVEGFPKYAELCVELFEAIDDRAIHAFTSELSLAEVLVKPMCDVNLAAVDAYKAMIRNRPSLEVWQVSRDVLVQAAQIRSVTTCKLPDAIHAATAMAAKADFIFTADQEFKAPSGLVCITLDELLDEYSA